MLRGFPEYTQRCRAYKESDPPEKVNRSGYGAGNYLGQADADIKQRKKTAEVRLCEALFLDQKTGKHCQGDAVSGTIKNDAAEQNKRTRMCNKRFETVCIQGSIKGTNSVSSNSSRLIEHLHRDGNFVQQG